MRTIFRSLVDIVNKEGRHTIEADDLKANYKTFISSNLKPDDPSYITIYHMIEAHYREYNQLPNILLLVQQAEHKGDEGVLSSLKDIILEKPYTGHNFIANLNTVCAAQRRDHLQDIIEKTWKIANDGLDIGFGKKKNKLQGISEAIDYFNRNVSSVLDKSGSQQPQGIIEPDIEKLLSIEDTSNVLYLPHAEMGKEYCYKPGQLIIVAARTGGNKSTRLLYESAYWTACGRSGLFFSLEMDPSDVYKLFYLTLNNTFLQDFVIDPELKGLLSDKAMNNSEFSEKDKKIFRNVSQIIADKDLGTFRVVDMPRLNSAAIANVARTFKQDMRKIGRRLDYIVVDYAGLMTPTDLQISRSGQTEYINQVIRELKLLALELKIPLITAFQLNRESLKRSNSTDRKSKARPKTFDLAWANECERSADKIIFIHPTFDDGIVKEFEIIIGKARRETTGKVFFSSLNLDTKVWSDGDGFVMVDSEVNPPAEEPMLKDFNLDI